MSKVRLVLLNIVLVLISMLGAVLIMVDFKKSVLSEFLERESWIQIIIAVVVLVVLDTGIDLWNSRKQRKEIERSEEHTSELQSRFDLVCRLLLEKKKKQIK